MASLTTVITNYQTILSNLTGMKGAGLPPESINQFPFGIAYPGAGEWSLIGGAWSEDFVDIIGEIHLSRQNLPKAIAAAVPYYELHRNALASNPTLSGAVQTLHGQDRAIQVAFGRLEWTSDRGKPEVHIGWRFTIRVKIHSDLT